MASLIFSGDVKDPSTGNGIVNARLRVYQRAADGTRGVSYNEGFTDATGRYSVTVDTAVLTTATGKGYELELFNNTTPNQTRIMRSDVEFQAKTVYGFPDSFGKQVAPIPDDSVTTIKLADANVAQGRGVSTAKIQDAAVTAAKVAADVATQAELDAGIATRVSKTGDTMTGDLTISKVAPGTYFTETNAPVDNQKIRDGLYGADGSYRVQALSDAGTPGGSVFVLARAAENLTEMRFGSVTNPALVVSNVTGALTTRGSAIWHAANDGAASGLDADLVDGQHAAAFAVSAHNHDTTYVDVTGDTMTGALTAAGGLMAQPASTAVVPLVAQPASGSTANIAEFKSATGVAEFYLNSAGAAIFGQTPTFPLVLNSQLPVGSASPHFMVVVDKATNIPYRIPVYA